MFVFLTHFELEGIAPQQLEDAFRHRLGAVDREPGFHYLQLWRCRRGPASHALLTVWEDAAALRRYLRSEAHARSHARIPPALQRALRPRHAAYDLVLDSRWRSGTPC